MSTIATPVSTPVSEKLSPVRAKTISQPRRSLTSKCLAHQLEISLFLLIIILSLNSVFPPQYALSNKFTPTESYHLENWYSKFIYLSYATKETGLVYKGREDAYVITFWIITFWFLREASMRFLWSPLARRCGVTEPREVARFAEQGWGLSVYSVSWSLGLYIMQSSPYQSFNTQHFWLDYPHDAISPLTKAYYLVQISFWLQTLVVLNLEARRKDYFQMLGHHFITVMLVSMSYILNFTRVGNAILVIMDLSDILLPIAKLFVYMKRPTTADFFFALFLISWVITRHILFAVLLYSVIFESRVYLPLALRVRDGYFFNLPIYSTFVGLLLSLQVLICIWFRLILKVAWNVIAGNGVDDTRSEADEDEARVEDLDDSVLKEDDGGECIKEISAIDRKEVDDGVQSGHEKAG